MTPEERKIVQHAQRILEKEGLAPLKNDEYEKCFVSDCYQPVGYEGWARNHDCVGMPTGLVIKVLICEQHKTHPWLCANTRG
jgi:hypothetical protein